MREQYSDAQLRAWLSGTDDPALFSRADALRREIYGTDVYIRGLIEVSNYCKNNCYYCGIRAANSNLQRYRLTREDLLACAEDGYALGFRTFVLQGGEDPTLTDSVLCDWVSALRTGFPDCAITLSLGERSYASYQALYDAGANRYLLRHETANPAHYARLHPPALSSDARKACLYNLKQIGYQVGSGFMVGAPYQTTDDLIADFRFLEELNPDMVGIGPFIPHHDTPFAAFSAGDLTLCLRTVAITRILLPHALIPATTALGTIHPEGRELGLRAGANVVMPNLSPVGVRKLYSLYDNKICTGEEAAECKECLARRVEAAGYHIVTDRGDVRR